MTITTRTDILTAAKAALVAAGTAAASRVYITRSNPVAPSEMPAITLTIEREQGEVMVPGQSGLCTIEWWRTSELQIGCFVADTNDADADAALTALVEEVREALLGDVTALAGIYQIDSTAAEYFVTTGQSAEYAAACRMVWSLRYDVQYGV